MLRHPSIAGVARALLDGVDKFTAMNAGAHRAATSPQSPLPEPTRAELEANDYPTGPVTWQGLAIQIENPAHTAREGVDPDGVAWRNVMAAHYGYFEGTKGADGDEVDVFVGPYPESAAAWILNQRDAAGGFDEHKVLAGFVDAAHALGAYRASYSAGWNRYAPPIPVSLAQLRWWLQFADHRRPFTLDLVPPEADMPDNTPAPLTRVLWDSAAMPIMGQTLAGVLYAIRQHDADDGLLLDPMTMAEATEGAEVVALDALVTEAGKLKPKMEALLRVMEAAGGEVKPVAVQFSDLMRRFGGVHVAVIYELSDGQTITAWFHNPDSTPTKFAPGDSLVSWKWQLNKKDVTIAVAPESGNDLNIREVARRLMRLAEKNSAAFVKANAKRAATMAEIQGLKDTLAERQGVLADLHQQIADYQAGKPERDAKKAEADRKAAEAAAAEQAYNDALDKQTELNGRARAISEAWRAEFPEAQRDEGINWRVGDVMVFYSAGDIAAQRHMTLDLLPFSKWTVKSVKSVASDVLDDGVRPVEDVAADIVAAIKANPAYVEPAAEPVYELSAVQAEGYAIGEAVGKSGSDAFLPTDSPEFNAAAEKYAGMPEVLGWLKEGFSDGYDAGRAAVTPAPIEVAPELQKLRDVLAGKFDTLALADLLTQIEDAVKGLDAKGLLKDEVDAEASAAITHWAQLEEAANG